MVESNRKYRPIIVLFGKSKTDFDFPKKSNHLLNLQPPTFPVKKREMQAVESFIYFANGGGVPGSSSLSSEDSVLVSVGCAEVPSSGKSFAYGLSDICPVNLFASSFLLISITPSRRCRAMLCLWTITAAPGGI